MGKVKEKIVTFLPKFELFADGRHLGSVKKNFSLFSPSYSLDFLGWKAKGNIFEWDYTIRDRKGNRIASISKELLNFTDAYVLDVATPADALYVLMFVLAVDAENAAGTRKKKNAPSWRLIAIYLQTKKQKYPL